MAGYIAFSVDQMRAIVRRRGLFAPFIILLALSAVDLHAQTFTDVAATLGVNDTVPGMAVWGDYDSDGDLDLYLIGWNSESLLYRNNGDGTFTEVGASAGVNGTGQGLGGGWADYDRDGDLDLYVIHVNNANFLYRNNGDGTFTEVGASAGVNNSGNAAGVAWGDYDNDGDPDLYIAHDGSANLLYRNNGDGTFTEVGSSAGVGDTGAGRGVGWGDYDKDGDLDLYVAMTSVANLLYRNDGDGTFTEVGSSAGVTDPANSGSGVAWSDYDNDGDLDLYLSNFSTANRLYRNDGSGTFSEVGGSAGVADTGAGRAVGWGDYDNDGDLDLYLVNAAANRLYRNDGGGTFAEVGSAEGVADGGNGHTVAWGDYDNDGDLDLYLGNFNEPNRLYQHGGTSNRWLTVKLVGTDSNKDGFGAQVTAVTGLTRQRRDVDGGGLYGQPALPVAFGFGSTTTVDSLIINWPSGIVQTLTNVSTNQVLTVTEQAPPDLQIAGQIVFESKRDGNREIYVMNADGTGQTRLTNNSLWDGGAKWSPDGTKIVFHSDAFQNGKYEVFVMNPDGSNQTNLTNNSADDLNPSWSPDGTKIAFATKRTGNEEVFVMNADGTGQTNLTNNSAGDGTPSWSPDGTMIAFNSNRNGNNDIFVMNVDGTGQTNLTSSSDHENSPIWSPDGTKIIYQRTIGGQEKVFVMNADGTGQTNLTNNPSIDAGPSWSADGKRILFQTDRDGNAEIYVMNADGSGLSNLTNNTATDGGAHWAPFNRIGSTDVGASVSRTMTIENNGSASLSVTNITSSDAQFTANPTNFTVAAGGSQDVAVTFTPTSAGTKYATLTISSNDPDASTVKLTVNGTGTQPPQFTDVGASAGVNNLGGLGVSWGDYDNDGDIDLSTIAGSTLFLYRNNGGGTFTEVGASAGINNIGGGEGSVWGDYDNDGDIDLYIVNAAGSNWLYRNNGDGTFTEVGASAGVRGIAEGRSAAWGDYDNDGNLDLYVTINGSPNLLYRNNGDGTFTEVGASAGVNDSGGGASAAWGDYDNDGDVDLYVGNFSGVGLLYRNNGDGTFTEVGASAGAASAGRSVAWGDYDNDGDLDIITDNLLRNNGDGTFTTGEAYGGNNVAWGDYDNDGDLDLYTVRISGSNWLYQNNGNGTFTEVGASAGVADTGTQYGVSWGDYDNDGDLDLYLVNWSNPNLLYRNNGNSNRWLQVKLIGTASNKNGIGAQVTAVTGATHQRRDVDGGSGYLSQPSLPVEFGFGSTTTVDSLIVRWPNGTVQTLTNVATNQILTVTEPLPSAPEISVPASLSFSTVSVGSSGQQTLTVSNTGNATLNVTDIAISGTDAGQFSVSSTSLSVAAGDSQDVTVTFSPTSEGNKAASLSITHDAAGSPSSISLSGTGVDTTPPAVPSDLTATAGNNQVALSWTANTESDLAYYVIYRSTTDGFTPAAGDSVGKVDLPGTSFTDTGLGAGAYYYRIAAVDNAGNKSSASTQASETLAPVISLSATSLSFGNVNIGSSGQQTLRIGNTGNATLSVTAISAAAPFSSSSTGPLSINPGDSTTVTITFSPTSAVTASETLTITHDASGSPSSVSLSGTGVDTTSPDAPSDLAATTGNNQVALSWTANTESDLAYYIIYRSTTDGFTPSAADSIGKVDQPGVTFTNTGLSEGTYYFKIKAVDTTGNKSGESNQASATLVPGISLSPGSLSFGNVDVDSSTTQTVTVSNTGDADLTVSDITVSGTDAAQFTISPTSFTINAGDSATATVTFAPTSVGNKSASLSIAHNAAGSPATVALSGTGMAAVISVSTPSLPFGDVQLGQNSPLTFTVENTGNTVLTVSGITVAGTDAAQFTVNPATFTVDAGSSQTVTVTFTPSSTGAKSATLSIAHNADGSPSSVSVTGNGTEAPVSPPVMGVTVPSLVMDDTDVGATSQKTFTINNTGASSLSVSGITVGGDNASEFTVSPTTATVAAGGSQTVTVSFSPTSAGGRSASLSIAHNASGSPTSISLSGTGVLSTVVVTVTITTVPEGRTVTVDGTAHTSPQTFTWTAGSEHTVAADSVQGDEATRYIFSSWSDGGAQSHSVTAPSSTTTYTANFTTQYFLTINSAHDDPQGGGWYDSGATVQWSVTSPRRMRRMARAMSPIQTPVRW